MTQATLVRTQLLGRWLLAAAALVIAGRPALAVGTVGSVIQLPGHISEIVLDEPRSSLYAANFTAGQVDVISTSTNRLVSSIKTGGQPSGAAMSPDGHYLVVTNYNNFGVSSLNSVVAIDLNDLTRRNFAMSNAPLSVAFGADGAALIVTTVDIVRFDPRGGTFELVNTIASLADALPVTSPTFPREITRASLSASGDGNYILGVTDTFVFAYKVTAPRELNFRLLTTFQRALAPPLATASFDGSYFMAGQYLLDRRMRVMAENVDADITDLNAGGHAIDFGISTVYSSYVDTANPIASTTGALSTGGASPSLTTQVPVLFVEDADNLRIRDRLRLSEQITGRMVLANGGRTLYAISQSGVSMIGLGDLSQQPQVRPNVEQLFVQFDYCQKTVARQTFRIENPAGAPADFKITTALRGVTFNPSSGVAPATIEMVVDFGSYSTVQGTTHGQVVITSQGAVNALRPLQLDINVKDVDQRGRIVPVPGKLVDILPDTRRDQFYVLEQTKNELHVFQNSDLRLLGTFRTGNRPNWLSLSADQRYLLVANSAGENLTVINLDNMQSEGYLFMPSGHYPMSVAADNASVLAAVRTPDGAQMDAVQVVQRGAFSMGRLGVYENILNRDTAMVPLPNLGGIFIVEADGNVKMWDANSQQVTLARKDFSGLKGALAAGPNAVVASNHILNMSLVPQADLADAPNGPAGFTFIGNQGIHTTSPGGAIVDTGSIQRVNTGTAAIKVAPVRMVEAPLTPLNFSFIRTLAGLRNGNVISTSSTGLVELPGNFDAAVAIPRVTAITSAADFSANLGQGGLVSIFGQNLAPASASAGATPLPTTLGDVCVTVNGFRLPLLYVSPGQINGQLPFELQGQVTTVLHTPGGLSDLYYAEVQQAAPTIFQIGVAGQSGTFPAIVRTRNNQLATLANPLHPNDIFLIYATGLGPVGPAVEPGAPGPVSPLAIATNPPVVTIGDRQAEVMFAGLAPGFVGVYQLNVRAPGDLPLGLQIPLRITAGGTTTAVNVRVVE